MKNKGITILLVALMAVIVFIILKDFNSKPDKRGENPYEFNIDEYREVDPALVLYKEVRNIKLKCEEPRGLHYAKGKLYFLADHFLQVLDPGGKQLLKAALPEKGRTLVVNENGEIMIAFNDFIAQFDKNGELVKKWDDPGRKTIFTSVALKDDLLFAADAGNRRVIKYSTDGTLLSDFQGKNKGEDQHGFIIPSPYFDLAVNEEGELWVVNSGNHSLENYTDDGTMRGFWKKTSIDIDGFSGCCNPAQMTLMPDGSFLTAEKGLVRMKIHKASGELLGVVAPPKKFKEDGHAPDLTVSPEGVIYALDYDKKLIRAFELKGS